MKYDEDQEEGPRQTVGAFPFNAPSQQDRITAYFEETKIPRIEPGQRVEIYLMSGGSPLRGPVNSVSRGITDRE